MKSKKRLAAKILKVSPKKVKFNKEALGEINKAITRASIRGLIATNQITQSKKQLHSRSGARKIAAQKKKGRRKNQGSRKGTFNARLNQKKEWINRVRVQRQFIKHLKEKKVITPVNFRLIYLKIKGGLFRNKRHLKLYLEENKLTKNVK